jgi:MFS family permease
MLRPGHFFRHEKTAEVITNHPVILTVVVCIAWTLFGLLGHDPWKSEEAVFMGHLSQLRDANFYFGLLDLEEIPLAGPLFYGVSLGSIDIFSPLLAAHDAARLTMAIWLLSAFLFVGLAGNELWGRSQSWLAPLLLLGSVGLIVKSHQISAAPLLMAGLSIFFYGLCTAPRLSIIGGLWLGIGTSIILLGTAPQNVLIPIVTIALIALANFRYRGLRFFTSLCIGGLIVLTSVIVWLITLYKVDPSLPLLWIPYTSNGAIHFFKIPSIDDLAYPLSIFPWFTWPTWIFVLWSIWIEGRDGLKRKELQLPIMLWISIMLVLAFTDVNKESGLIPILLPLALIGSIAATRIPKGAGNALYWFAVMTASCFTIAAWVYFSASHFGFPQELSAHLSKLQPGYQPGNRTIDILIAAAMSSTWFLLLFNIKRRPERSVVIWAINLTFGWMLAVILLFHWIDERKTYAPMVKSIMSQLDTAQDCIITQVGPAQRGLIEYFGGIKTTNIYLDNNSQHCNYLIYQDRWDDDNHIGPPWELIWQGGRSGDRSERYWLFKRDLRLK